MKALDTLELTHRITRRTLDGIIPNKYCLALLATDNDSSTGSESATLGNFIAINFSCLFACTFGNASFAVADSYAMPF